MNQQFEVIVRPFQTNDVSVPQRYVTANQRSNPPIILMAGRSGRGKTMSGSLQYQKTFYCDQQIVEKSQ